MKSWVKEVIWFVGTLVVAYLLFDPSLTFNIKEATVDINVHDTYFVVASLHILILIVVAVFFLVYLIRMLIYRFKNRTVNIVFLIANAFQALIFVGLTHIVKYLIDMKPMTGEYISHSSDRFPKYYTLIIITILLAVFEVFVLYKTIILYKKSKQDK